jgi:6-pyruvoyltetrahydropterin/6-carboxytetrahydropterin synthase
MILTKTFTFDAAHKLSGLPRNHKCSRVHGHTYRVEIGIKGDMIDSKTGFLAGFDFTDLEKSWMPLYKILDHHDLNRVSGLGNPTCENLTVWIAKRLLKGSLQKFLSHIRVYESSTTYCQVDVNEISVFHGEK